MELHHQTPIRLIILFAEDPLAQRVVKPAHWNDWIADWYAWRTTKYEVSDENKDERADTAISWWFDRRLDTGYLVMGPDIWFWSDGEHMHIVWDNRHRVQNGIRVWDAGVGQSVLPISAFIAEFVAYSHRFLSEMAARIVKVPTYWSPTKQELREMQKEQERRTSSWDGFLQHSKASRDTTNWEQVIAAIAAAEKDVEFQRIREQGTHSFTERDQ